MSHLPASLMEAHAFSCGLQVADALIAATAREAGEILATGNIRHFRPIAGCACGPFVPMRRERVPQSRARQTGVMSTSVQYPAQRVARYASSWRG